MSVSKSNFILFALASVAALTTFVMTASANDEDADTPLPAPALETDLSDERAEAYFAGGCFWCLEADFDKVEGVVETVSGYTGGDVENPTYKQVTYKNTGHYEAVKVVYDPQAVTYSELVDYFWHHVDPTDGGGQFCDRGFSYLTGIFPSNAAEAEIAAQSKAQIENAGYLGAPIVTKIADFKTFWPAEDYHQDYYLKNRLHYSRYRRGCGRDQRVAEVWSGETLAAAEANGHGS